MTDKLEEGKKPEHNMGPGWMLKGDPELAAKVEKAKKKYKEFKKNVGKKVDEEVALDEANKHSFIGKIQRGHELKKKVDSTWKDISDAQKQGDKQAGSKAFRKHERYANLERPGTFTKVKEDTELDEAVVQFPKKKSDAPREIGKDDVENAWALKHVAAKDDKISYQHNGVTLHHANGDHTFILGGHQPLFDRDPKGKLKFKDDLGPARRAFKMPTQKASKSNVVSLKKEEVEQIDEARINGREYASQGLMHPDHAKMDIHKVSGQHVDFYASKTGDKMQGKVVKNDGKQVHIQAHSDKEIGDGKLHKFKVQGHLNQVHEELQGSQHKLDADKDGKLEKSDFEKLRARRKKIEESTPYYNKPSFLKRMGAAAKQERLAREKKERESKQVKEAKDGLEGACWKGYTAVGMKMKNGKKVPNCVPVKEEHIEEKLDMDKATMGDVIKDFKKSDAPQFKGKSAEKRREMAIAAKLSNEETEMSEQEHLDEQEQLDELSKKTLGSYVKKAANDKADTAFHRGYSAYNNSDHKPYSEPMANKVHAGQENRNKGIKRAVARLTKEEHTMSFKAFLEEGLTEGVWPGTPEYKAKFPETSRGKVGEKKAGAKGTQTVTGTGVKHERDYEKAEKEGDAPESTEKRGRGRPKGSASGARQKGSAPKNNDGVDYTGYPLHLPNGRR